MSRYDEERCRGKDEHHTRDEEEPVVNEMIVKFAGNADLAESKQHKDSGKQIT